MAVGCTAGLIEKSLGSTHLFTLALTEAPEDNLLREAETGRVTPVSDVAASKAIGQLVRSGLLERTQGKQDRRSSEPASTIVATSSDSEQICLQCGVYLQDRCLLHEAVRRTCQYRRKSRQSTRLPQGGRTT